MDILFWGRATCDLTYKVADFPEENKKTFSEEFIIQPGGPALNAAITYSYLGGKGIILSSFGNNDFSKSVKSRIFETGLKLIDICKDEEFEIPLSTIVVNSKKSTRTIINSPVTNYKASKIKNEVEDKVLSQKPKLVLIDGYELHQSIDLLVKLKKQGSIIIYDGGSWKENIPEYIKYVDMAICSNSFRFLDTDFEETVSLLKKSGVSKVAFTMEDKPVLAFENDEKFEIPVEKINAVDTLGAGDVFHGAFCYYYLKSGDFVSSLTNAAKIAALSCRYFGTHTWQKKEVSFNS